MATSSSISDDDKAVTSDNNFSPLLMFTAKTVIVVSVCTTAILVASSYVSSNLLKVVDRAEEAFKFGSALSRLETELDKLADPNSGLTPERRERLLVKLRAASDKWKPFLTQAYEIISEPPAKPPSKSP